MANMLHKEIQYTLEKIQLTEIIVNGNSSYAMHNQWRTGRCQRSTGRLICMFTHDNSRGQVG